MTTGITQGTDGGSVGSWGLASPTKSPGLAGRFRTLTGILVLAASFLAAAAGVGYYWCGSLTSAIAFLRGDSLIPDAYLKSFGSTLVGSETEVRFRLWNRTGRVIRILGAKTSCTCLVTSELPRDVAPGGRTDLMVTVRAKKPGSLSQSLQVITDDRSCPSPILAVTGVVRGVAETKTVAAE